MSALPRSRQKHRLLNKKNSSSKKVSWTKKLKRKQVLFLKLRN